MSCYGVLLDPGPGDTLRFLHAFCQLLKEKESTGIVFCMPQAYQKIRGLFSVVDQEIELVKCSDFSAIRSALLELPPNVIWYCFDIKYINLSTKTLPKEITAETGHTFVMIDRFNDHTYMQGCIGDHLRLPRFPVKDKALLFLRNMPICPERNMNRDILNAITRVSAERGIRYDIVGDIGASDWDAILAPIREETLFSCDYPDYLTQLYEYSRYSFAIGMNSGGLDMAIAAGVVGIRIGEFHQHYSWLGPHYNDFLSSSLTINIASLSEKDVSNINESAIRRAIDLVISSHKKGVCWI